MLCALHRERSHEIPKDKIQLYNECCRLLLEERDVVRNVDVSDYPNLTERQKRLILEDLAYWLIDNDEDTVAIERIEQRIAEKLVSMQKLDEKATGKNVLEYFIHKNSTAERPPSEGEIDFTHRTFQEYLAAHHASDQRNIGRLVWYVQS